MSNPSRLSLGPERLSPFHKLTITDKPHLPPPSWPTRSPDPPKAPSPSPLSESEYLDLGSGAAGHGQHFNAGEGGSGQGAGEECRKGDDVRGGNVMGVRNTDEGDTRASGIREHENICDAGTMLPGGILREQRILEHETKHAVRAALDSLWGSHAGKGVFDGSMPGNSGDDLEKAEVDNRTERLARASELKTDMEGKRERNAERVTAWLLTHGSPGALSMGDGELQLRDQRRHHCILDGHLFEKCQVQAICQERRNQKTRNKIEDTIEGKKTKCWRCSKMTVEGGRWVCKVEICGMEACKGCVKRWERERRQRITESWMGKMDWEALWM